MAMFAAGFVTAVIFLIGLRALLRYYTAFEAGMPKEILDSARTEKKRAGL